MITTIQWTMKNYGTYNAVIYTPDNLKGQKKPVFIFIPGNGEVGTDPNTLYINSPLKFIKAGWKPDFMIVAIQPLKIWPLKDFLQNAIDNLKDVIYEVDFNKMYLTGLSGGGQCIWNYMHKQADASFIQPAGVIPFSYVANAQCGDFYQKTDYLCGTDLRFKNTACWGLCGKDDSFYGKQKRYVELLMAAGYNAKFTTYPGGHCCWETYYDPNFKEAGKNIYEWSLQFSLGVTTLPTTYQNLEASKEFMRDNCAKGETGSIISYTVVAGKHKSTISQADADAQAQADIAESGQNYANMHGECELIAPIKKLTNIINVYSDGSTEIKPQ